MWVASMPAHLPSCGRLAMPHRKRAATLRHQPACLTAGPRPATLRADWMQQRSEIGMYPIVAADWRSDVRCRDTGDPTDPVYREWTHKEIWDLITLGGKAADPRVVRVTVEDPLARAGA